MSSFQLGTNLIVTFILASSLLYRYGNWYRHRIVISLAVLVAWYFSFIIIFVLPLDVSTTVYMRCAPPSSDAPSNISIISNDTTQSNLTSPLLASSSSSSTFLPQLPSSSSLTSTSTLATESHHDDNNSLSHDCPIPWSSPAPNVLTNLWRIVYWSSQCLTWLILPIMQSYTKAGEFHVKGKLKSALRDNLIYYASYLFICGILLAYIVLKPNLHLNSWEKIKLVASSASNTWSLFLLVFMLGHGLIAIPRNLYKSSLPNHSLNAAYFKVAKLANERNDSEELLEDALDTFHSASQSITDPNLIKYLDVIYIQIPTEFRERLKRRRVSPSDNVHFSEVELVKLNRLMKRALGCWHRTETLWGVGVERAIHLEEVEMLRRSGPSSVTRRNRNWTKTIYWVWTCVLQNHLLRILSALTALFSLAVIWSEVTFFNKKPVLSLFAIFVNSAAENSYNYFLIEFVATLTIAYLCTCAYYTVFKIRFFNYYYLAAGHQTDEYSLIFCGMLLCRLTPPLCLNFLGLIHMDSHIVGQVRSETSYTKVMGHMDVLSIISDGFNIYFPMGILVIGLLTWFRVGARLLSAIGFQQFLSEDDEMTTEMIGQGSDLVKREKRRKLRQESSISRNQQQPQQQPSFGAGGDRSINSSSYSSYGGGTSLPQRIDEEDPPVDTKLTGRDQQGRSNYYGLNAEPPPRDLFDDV